MSEKLIEAAAKFLSRGTSSKFRSQEQDVAEETESKKQAHKVIAVDKSNALGKKVKLNVKADSHEELFDRLHANGWHPLKINGVDVVDGKHLKKD